MRYHIKERAFLQADDFDIFDENQQEVYEVKGKIFEVADTFSMCDKKTGQEILQIKQRIFAQTKQFEIFSNNTELATLRQKPATDTPDDHFEITTRDGMILQIEGNYQMGNFKITDHHTRLLGTIYREWAFLGDSYTIDIAPGVDAPFVLALVIILDEIRENIGK